MIVTGTDTDVGKTVVSAILTNFFKGDYWKPIQCGEEATSDTEEMKKWLDLKKHRIHPPAYSLKAPLSPHHAARLENISIDPERILLPKTSRPLIIETAGGIFVPLSCHHLAIDVFQSWKYPWIVVSKHYLGSINHTLLTLNALKQRDILVAGLIFNGEPNPDSEAAILKISNIPCLGHLLPEPNINQQMIQRYQDKWRVTLSQLKV